MRTYLKGHYGRGAQIVQKSSNHLKILGTRRVTWSMSHTQNSQICHHWKFSRHGVLASRILAPLV